LQGGREELDDQGGIPLVQPASAGRRGAVPLLLEAHSSREEAQWIADRVSEKLASGTAPSDLAILARTKSLLQPVEQALARRKVPLQSMAGQSIRSFDWSAPSVKLLTLHSAKGPGVPRRCTLPACRPCP
jgi:superfamily I DNA/RNA helicase